jgi:hypothetical protein
MVQLDGAALVVRQQGQRSAQAQDLVIADRMLTGGSAGR